MSNDAFRFVIVGSGNISRTYVKAIGKLESISVAGLVSRSGRRPDNLDEKTPVFASLADVDVPYDAVVLCTPNGLHHKGAIEASRLGKHVLTEKTLDISSRNMDLMMTACDEAGVKLGVSYQRRMSPDNIVVKRLLETEALGRVFAADMRVKFFRDTEYYNSGAYRGGFAVDGGGPFMQQAAHNVDLFCWFFGMPLRVISMLGTFAHDIEVEDHGVALLRFEDGMIGTITASSATKPGFATVLEIHTTRGTIGMENDEITTWSIDGLANPSRRGDFQVHSGSNSAAVADTAGHEAILQDFADAVRENREPAVPAASARMATELVLRIYGSNIP